MKLRTLHRDLGYFYLGLIITFAFSGILMNHRDQFHAEEYDVQTKEIAVQLPEKEKITEEYAKNFIKNYNIEDTFKRYRVKNGSFRIAYKNTDVEVELETGKGEIVTYKKTPFISQAMFLHKSTSNWWIYFSDVFGLSLIFIAISGAMMVKHGKHTFKRRGWKLAVAGLLFPIIFLFFLN
ncbi:MAG: hypothetical protein ACI9Q3_001411 [Maribacter sp.]|jgi:hypothetical protein